MRILIPAFLALSTLPLAGAACPTGAVSTCEAQVRLDCEFAFRCCDDDERIEGNFGGNIFVAADYTNSEQECIERNLPICKAFLGGIDESISLGRISFNQENANACIAARTAARDECVRQLDEDGDEACSSIFEGLVEDGDACASGNECADGGTCDLSDAEPNEELGVNEGECVAALGAGDVCDDAVADCGEGLFCNDDGVCEALPGVGDPCPEGECADGAFCDFDNGECAAQKDDGEACVNSEECRSFECDDGTCGNADDICTGR